MKIEFEWVKIEAGEFKPGFTETQKQKIREMASAKIDFSTWTKQSCALLEEFLIKYRQYCDKSLPSSPYPRELYEALIPLITEDVSNLLKVERELAKSQTTTEATKIEQFYMTRYPVTVEQFTPFFRHIKDRLSRRELQKLGFSETLIDAPEERNTPAGVNRVVITKQFCEAVGGRLPTLFEWEYAARGKESLLYPWGNEWKPEHGNFAPYLAGEHQKGHKKGRIITAVDTYPGGVSPFGLWDMVGNMQERVDGWANKRLTSCKGPSIREVDDPVWLWYLPGLDNDDGCEVLPGYTGFRVVKDKWEPQLWAGFEE